MSDADAVLTVLVLARLRLGDVPPDPALGERLTDRFAGREGLLAEAALEVLVRVLESVDNSGGPANGWTTLMLVQQNLLAEGDSQ